MAASFSGPIKLSLPPRDAARIWPGHFLYKAGTKLAKALESYRDKNVLVLGIPRGGVETAYYVAKHLNAELSVIVSRKLPFPDNPEAGFGAITEDGSVFLIDRFKGYLPGRIFRH